MIPVALACSREHRTEKVEGELMYLSVAAPLQYFFHTHTHTHNQNESRCISSVETGSRLTCVTVVCPENLLKELKQSKQLGNSGKGIVHQTLLWCYIFIFGCEWFVQIANQCTESCTYIKAPFISLCLVNLRFRIMK